MYQITPLTIYILFVFFPFQFRHLIMVGCLIILDDKRIDNIIFQRSKYYLPTLKNKAFILEKEVNHHK